MGQGTNVLSSTVLLVTECSTNANCHPWSILQRHFGRGIILRMLRSKNYPYPNYPVFQDILEFCRWPEVYWIWILWGRIARRQIHALHTDTEPRMFWQYKPTYVWWDMGSKVSLSFMAPHTLPIQINLQYTLVNSFSLIQYTGNLILWKRRSATS